MKQPSVSRFVFLLSPLFSFPFIIKDIYEKKKLGLIMFSVFIGICVYLFLPHELMDSAKRYKLYEGFKGVSTEQFINGYLAYRSDYIFYSLIYLFAALNIKYQILLFLFGVFNVGVPLFIFDKIIDKHLLSQKEYLQSFLLIFLSISLTFLFSGIRQLVALNFISLSFYYLYYKKNISLTLFFIALGTLTHFSVGVFILLIYIGNKISIRILVATIILSFIIGLIVPDSLIQSLFLDVDTSSDFLNSKIEGYSNTESNSTSTTLSTAIAKVINGLWFYFSIIFLIFYGQKHQKLFRICLSVLLPISLLYTFPGISGRYISYFKIIFALILIKDYIDKKSLWLVVFIFLYSIEPLYDVFRLMTNSFMAIFSLNHLTSVQIFIEEYSFKDMLK